MQINSLQNVYSIQPIKCKDSMKELPNKNNSQKENRKKQKRKNFESEFKDVLKYNFDIKV